MTDVDDTELDCRKLYWHSRRGMLELDLVLLPFASLALPQLDQDTRQLYRELLSQEDQDLYSWLLGRVKPPSESLERIVTLVRDFQQSGHLPGQG